MYSWRQLKQSAAATNLTLTIVLVLHFYFYFVCSCSAHLPGAWQSITTGHGGPSWDSIPDQVLWPPPSLRDPLVKGGCDWTEVSLSAVRGHGDSTLLMIDWESGVYRSCLKMHCTSMDRTMSCRQSSRTPHVAFVPHDRTANVTDWLDMKLSMYGGQAYSHPF